jgi:hypothetical protein
VRGECASDLGAGSWEQILPFFSFVQKSCKRLARFERFSTTPPFDKIKKLYGFIKKIKIKNIKFVIQLIQFDQY